MKQRLWNAELKVSQPLDFSLRAHVLLLSPVCRSDSLFKWLHPVHVCRELTASLLTRTQEVSDFHPVDQLSYRRTHWACSLGSNTGNSAGAHRGLFSNTVRLSQESTGSHLWTQHPALPQTFCCSWFTLIRHFSPKCLTVIHTDIHTDGGGCRASCWAAHQEQFGLQYLAQGHLDTLAVPLSYSHRTIWCRHGAPAWQQAFRVFKGDFTDSSNREEKQCLLLLLMGFLLLITLQPLQG